ncbi:hypothetical protein HPC62_19915 [Thermoleptolyngbya sichuanensis A183]|uniref:Uncharacterized protein n=1 Tax=Thermoleptolyngbya sichuanensis A183 TaxID=2737172 RepID=A0A6M8B9K7_9CYAN|nr:MULTISPECIES: hypothetical protein [Thermoleptolyngbya]MDG2616005.1 hypothetical protein [Thermoleptolyngbya sichuanensis XZ-Cy5]QKD80766.1 hypothetical protein HPC62_19915 [Thermoleptolyngbya sichuanensis A183]
MNTPWKRLLQKTAGWLVVEVMMNLTGLDTLADFGEFLFDLRPVALQSQPSDLITTLHQPSVPAWMG